VQSLPSLVVDISILKWNMTALLRRCREWNICPVAVTKGCLADPVVIEALWEREFRSYADANLGSLLSIRKRYGAIPQLQLIRLPMRWELEPMVEAGIIAHLSHVEALDEINTIAQSRHCNADVFLTVEAGDGREGFLPAELLELPKFQHRWSHVRILGISLSLACLSGVLPYRETIHRALAWREEVSCRLERSSLLLSVGGSTFLPLWEDNRVFEGVNQVRVGEAWLLGTDISRKNSFAWLKQGAFTIRAEVVEVRSKEVNIKDTRGFNVFGRVVEPQPGKQRRRVLLAVGAQDIDETQLYLLEENAKIIGVTSNYLVLDVEECTHNYQPGEVVELQAGYGTVMRAYLSPFIKKMYTY